LSATPSPARRTPLSVPESIRSLPVPDLKGCDTDMRLTRAAPHGADQAPALIVVTGPMEGTVWPLPSRGVAYVGGGGGNGTAAIWLDDVYVSRNHAVLAVESYGSIVVRDAGSRGGTYVLTGPGESRRVVEPYRLGVGEAVQVSPLTTLRIRLG
jgi:hypothetical protein